MKWKDRIAEAKKRGYFTADDVADSSMWSRCACCKAEHEFDIKRGGLFNHCPADKILINLGLFFADAVGSHNVEEAEEIHQEIQSRVKELENLANS